jgi:hypothetical protein
MTTTRREFMERTAGAMFLGSMPFSRAELSALPEQAGGATPQWDLTWVQKITGKHKVVLDVPEVESGFGVFRASIWAQQYGAVMGATPKDMTSVLVLRHNAIVLAMQQKFWDDYEIGTLKNVTHPATDKPTNRNPALLSSTRAGDDIPAQWDNFALDKFMSRGGIVLGCTLAMDFCVRMMAAKDKTSEDVARKKALSLVVPGIIMQPSGVFAAIRAQEAGCSYLRAS